MFCEENRLDLPMEWTWRGLTNCIVEPDLLWNTVVIIFEKNQPPCPAQSAGIYVFQCRFDWHEASGSGAWREFDVCGSAINTFLRYVLLRFTALSGIGGDTLKLKLTELRSFFQVTFLGFNEETDAAHIQVRWGTELERSVRDDLEQILTPWKICLISSNFTLNSSAISPVWS